MIYQMNEYDEKLFKKLLDSDEMPYFNYISKKEVVLWAEMVNV